MPIFSSPLPGRARASALLTTVLLVSSCASYQAAPIDSLAVLEDLGSVRFESPQVPAEESGRSFGPAELSAFAITHNPDLRVARHELAVSGALLVEAGLLPNPEFSWDAMNALGSSIIGESPTDHDYWSGLGTMFSLPRPGELSARKGAARWGIEEARSHVLFVEWQVTRAVHMAFEELVVARKLAQQNTELLAVVERTLAYFTKAREAKVATAIEATLAEGDVLELRRESLALSARVRRAAHELNGLLGLPPETQLALDKQSDLEATLAELPGLEELDELALTQRPDLARQLAAYQVAEEELRLQVALQYPALALGTGFSIELPIFNRFNAAAIETASLRRAQLAEQYRAAVHESRRELHAAYAAWEEAKADLSFIEDRLIPNAESSLELADLAFRERVATLVQILNIQRSLIRVRTSHIEAEARYSRAAWELLSASGAILANGASAQAPNTTHDEH